MRFSWKICFSTILISILIFSIGGYILISALFQSTYKRELSNAAEENQIMRYSLVAYWNTTVQELTVSRKNVEKAAKTMTDGMKDSRIRIMDVKGQVLFDNTQTDAEPSILHKLTADTLLHRMRKTEKGWELQTVGGICTEEDEMIYLETIRDLSPIFAERDRQYHIYLQWMACVLIIESVCCYVMTVWLLKPLKSLSEAAGKISEGELEVRAKITTQDEIGELAADFNHMAENLEKQFFELEEAARKQEDFMGSFAHELKTPLTSMIGYADMLRTQSVSQEEQFQAANYIFKEGKRLENLSFKLLELLVIKNQKTECKYVSVKWLAEEIKGVLNSILEKEKILLEMTVEDAKLWMEPDLMKTVLLNLLDNGRKAVGKEGRLQLLGKKREKGYSFYVCDNGKGIPREEITRITEAFYMVDKSRARKQGGAGLGLSICAEIIRQHQGVMEFESTLGKGTCVHVYLPKEDLE